MQYDRMKQELAEALLEAAAHRHNSTAPPVGYRTTCDISVHLKDTRCTLLPAVAAFSH